MERYNLTSEPTLRLKMLRKYLCHAVDWAVSRRARHLRKSPAYFSLVGGTAAAGFLPFGKTGANAVASSMFLSKTLAAFGLEDQDALLELTWDTAVTAGIIEERPLKIFASEAKGLLKKLVTDDAKDFWQNSGMAEEFQQELAAKFGDEAAGEMVHLLPIVGHIWSVGSGVYKAVKTLGMVLTVVTQKATQFHKEILVLAATEKLMCVSLIPLVTVTNGRLG